VRRTRRHDPIEIPDGVVDAHGVRLSLGAVVVIREGRFTGSVGEVSRWVGERGVEVIVPEPIPELVAVTPSSVVKLDVTPIHPIVRTPPRL
jgi:hypothetical protein